MAPVPFEIEILKGKKFTLSTIMDCRLSRRHFCYIFASQVSWDSAERMQEQWKLTWTTEAALESKLLVMQLSVFPLNIDIQLDGSTYCISFLSLPKDVKIMTNLLPQ